MPRTLFLHRPEGRIAYESLGSGPPVICVPGMGDLRSSYRALAPELAAAGFRAISMDLRGHGESDTEFSTYGDTATAEDIAALLTELNEPAVVVGNSMAAGSAVIAAAHSPLIRGLVLVGPFIRNPPGSAATGLLFKIALFRPWGRALWNAYLPSLYAGIKPADFEDHRAAIRASLRDRRHYRAFVRTTRTDHAPAEAALNHNTPALIVMGEKDPDFRDPGAEAAFISRATGGEILMVPEAGHYPHAQRPELVSPAVITFMRAHLG